MIHVLTVHWKDDRWVDIQLAYLRRNVPAPFQVYAFLNHLARDHRAKYFYSSQENIASHAVKLNLMADMVALHSANHDDWLLFLDGDAFPVADIVAYGEEKLKKHPLAAIQRVENHGDIQPHPSFCLTTIRFWKEIGGDWKEGFCWTDQSGESVTDVGGNLLEILNNRGVDWFPMRRSNKTDLHPLWFGLYDGVVYHHGAGFRAPFARVDSVRSLAAASRVPRIVRKVVRRIQARFAPLRRRVIDRNRALSEQVFQSIARDPLFYQRFQEPNRS
jgi:hypothetical protein